MRIFLFVILLLISVNTFAQQASTPIRAAQVFYSGAKNYKEFEREVVRMKNLGVNILIFRVFGNEGDRIYKFANAQSEVGVYFKTAHSPVIDDLLGDVTKIAHKHGIKIFAWMTTRHATYAAEDNVLDHAYSLSESEYKTVSKLDLFDEKAVWELQQLYVDLAEYSIDGILFQDDFVMRHMEGFGTEARVQYLSEFDKDLEAKNMYSELELKDNGRVKRIVYSEEFWRFQNWKNARLIIVADELVKIVKKVNPQLKVALNVGYELFNKPKNALAWYAHDDRLVRKFDYVAVMAYQDQMMKELGISLDKASTLIKSNTINAVGVMGSPERVIIKIQTKQWDTGKDIPLKDIRFVYQKVKAPFAEVGIAVVPWENRNYNFIRN